MEMCTTSIQAWTPLKAGLHEGYLSTENDFDLSSINFDQDIPETSLSANFVQNLLADIDTSDFESSPNFTNELCYTPQNLSSDWPESDCASVASLSTISGTESCSVISEDEGFVSLDQCSASLSDLIDPDDFNALLDTLTASLPEDVISSVAVCDSACVNLSQCSNSVRNIQHEASTPGAGTTNNYKESKTSEAIRKPDISYIELVARAIMSSPDNSVLLADIYQWIECNYPYYKNTTNSWRNSIRHNLSVNECFVKSKRVRNGRGFYWSIHSSCIDAFSRGDFDRRKARRQVQECNRAFTSAFAQLQELTQGRSRTRTMNCDVQNASSAPAYLPPCSTPIRSYSPSNVSSIGRYAYGPY